jgi:ribosomal protein S18 acetylase RimI-like enzyme
MSDYQYVLEEVKYIYTDFLYDVYASTREAEMAKTGWDNMSIDQYLHLQFKLQNTQFHHNYPKASYNIISWDGNHVGRLFVNRAKDEIRIIDFSLLTKYRNKGLGTRIMRNLVAESEKDGKPLRLSVERSCAAIRLFEREGFTATEDLGAFRFMQRLPSSYSGHSKNKGKK